MVANDTWRGATNECLRLALLPTIDSDALFNDDQNLEEYHSAAKYYTRLAHHYLTIRAVRHFASRLIPLLVDGTNDVYPVDTGLNPSAIKFRSFFNVSTGAAAAQNCELRYVEYEDWLRENPDPSQIPAGPPKVWMLLPLDRTAQTPVWKIRISPIPDQPYQLQYRAKLNPYPLAQASDIILWPFEYQHVLWCWSWGEIEQALGEGKEGNIKQMAQQAANDVNLVAGSPPDAQKAVRTMQINSRSPWPPGKYSNYIFSPPG